MYIFYCSISKGTVVWQQPLSTSWVILRYLGLITEMTMKQLFSVLFVSAILHGIQYFTCYTFIYFQRWLTNNYLGALSSNLLVCYSQTTKCLTNQMFHPIYVVMILGKSQWLCLPRYERILPCRRSVYWYLLSLRQRNSFWTGIHLKLNNQWSLH